MFVKKISFDFQKKKNDAFYKGKKHFFVCAYAPKAQMIRKTTILKLKNK